MTRSPKKRLLAAVMLLLPGCGGGAADPGDTVTAPERADAITPAAADVPSLDDAPKSYPGDAAGGNVEVGEPVLAVTSVLPASGPSNAPTTVTIHGSGFTGGVQVFFGTAPGMNPFVLNDTIMNCTAPPHPAGTVDVEVTVPSGLKAVKEHAFTYVSDLLLSGVDPGEGPGSGGTPVRVNGSGFLAEPTFLFGGRVVPWSAILDDGTALVVTPPNAPGTVDVIALSGDVKARLDAAFEYRQEGAWPQVPGLSVKSCQPSTGPAGGGTVVYVYGSGFTAGAAVRIGALPATGVEVLGPGLLRAVTPPGSPGPADVVVALGPGRAVLPNGFEYDGGGPEVLLVEPDSGSWAGGTLVRIHGFGLSQTTKVLFGNSQAHDVEVVSDVEVRARTPRADSPGPVPVTLSAGGASSADSAFFYFDPTLKGGGTWGGAIAGDVNVTVMDGSTGKPLHDAYVIMGHDMHTPFQGRTDDRGQVTFSAEGVSGPVTVSAAKEGFTAYTVAGFDARNVTVYLSPASVPEGQGLPPWVNGDRCTVKGVIKDYGKYFLKPPWVKGQVRVLCTTSSRSLFGGNPDPGPGSLVDEHGRFEITTRTGKFAVICAMVYEDTWLGATLSLRLGVVRNLACPKAAVIDGVEVQLSYDTNADVWLGFPGLPGPLADLQGPFVFGGYKLGDDGYMAVPRPPFHEAPDRLLFSGMPRVFEGALQGHGFSIYSSLSSKSSGGLPYSVVLALGHQAPSPPSLLVAGDSGMEEIGTSLFKPITAMCHAEGTLLAADRGGGVYWFDGNELFRAPLDTHVPVYALACSSMDDFWAAGAGGSLWRVQDGAPQEIETGVTEDFTGAAGTFDSVHLVAGEHLVHIDGSGLLDEVPAAGNALADVDVDEDGVLYAAGRGGLVLVGPPGGPYDESTPVETDLKAITASPGGGAWAVGDEGVVVRVSADAGFDVLQVPGSPALRGVLVRKACDVLVFGLAGAVFTFDCSSFTDVSRPDTDMDLLAGGFFDGVPVLGGRRFMRMPSYLGFPQVTYPVDGGAWDGSRLAWTVPGTQQDTHQQVILSGPDSRPFWLMMIAGGARDVDLPDLDAVMAVPVVPKGSKRMNITVSRTPGFDIDHYSSKDLGYYDREAFAVQAIGFE